MRLTRRQPAETPRGPVAAYAAVLDGRHLWLALHPGHGGTPALRRTGGGDHLPLDGEVPDDPRYDARRVDLTAVLPPEARDGTYDVVVRPARGRGDKPVWSPPFPAGVARTPPTPDGRAVLELERTDDGLLRLRCRPLPATAELEAVEVRGDRVHLSIRPPGEVRPGTHLLLLDTDDRPMEVLPVTAHDGLLEALVGVDDLPAGYFGLIRVAVGTEDSWVRIRRAGSDLADPNHAVLLPELYAEHGDVDRPRARFRWNPDALLALRSLDPDDPSGP